MKTLVEGWRIKEILCPSDFCLCFISVGDFLSLRSSSAAGCHGVSRGTRRRRGRRGSVDERRQRGQEDEVGSGAELGQHQVNLSTSKHRIYQTVRESLEYFSLFRWKRNWILYLYLKKTKHMRESYWSWGITGCVAPVLQESWRPTGWPGRRRLPHRLLG